MKRKILALVLVMMLALSTICVFAEENEGEWWNILLLGGDSRSTTAYGRTDTIIILSVNLDKSLVKMTSIMRDTWVGIPGHSSNKINAANVFGGPELAMQVINDNFGTELEDYVLINMYDLFDIIDMVGGVDVEVTEAERKYVNSYAKDYLSHISSYSGETSLNQTGLVHLNGLLATAYCRIRYTDSDYVRVMRQQEVLLSVARQIQDMDVNDLMEIVDVLTAKISTNLKPEELKTLATAGLVMEIDDVEQNRIPVDGTFKSGMFGDTWMIKPDFAKNASLLHDFIYGE